MKWIIFFSSSSVVNKSTGSKNVMLLTTLQPITDTTKGDKEHRPMIIEFYNFSKGGTDIGTFSSTCMFPKVDKIWV